jgi:DNA-binding winged helix-turn-helix (wHTH) protein
VRRLRAKLGAEYEALIGTVRNVGYKFVKPTEPGLRARGEDSGEQGYAGDADHEPSPALPIISRA